MGKPISDEVFKQMIKGFTPTQLVVLYSQLGLDHGDARKVVVKDGENELVPLERKDIDDALKYTADQLSASSMPQSTKELPAAIQALLPAGLKNTIMGDASFREKIAESYAGTFFEVHSPEAMAKAFVTQASDDPDKKNVFLYNAASKAVRYGAPEFLDKLFEYGFKPDEWYSERLVAYAIMRKDSKALNVLRERLGEDVIRKMNDVDIEFVSDKPARTVSNKEINRALDEASPRVKTSGEHIFPLEAKLFELGKDVEMDGDLSENEIQTISDHLRERGITAMAAGDIRETPVQVLIRQLAEKVPERQ